MTLDHVLLIGVHTYDRQLDKPQQIVTITVPNRNGLISTPRLNALLHVHLVPINLIISQGSHNEF